MRKNVILDREQDIWTKNQKAKVSWTFNKWKKFLVELFLIPENSK